jgi:hypothetical protein
MNKLEKLKKLLENSYRKHDEMSYEISYKGDIYSITMRRYDKNNYEYNIIIESKWNYPTWNESGTISFLSILKDIINNEIIEEIQKTIPEFEKELPYLINLSIKNDDFYWLSGGDKRWKFGKVYDDIITSVEIELNNKKYQEYDTENIIDNIDFVFLNRRSREIYEDFIEYLKYHDVFKEDVIKGLKKIMSLKDLKKQYEKIEEYIESIYFEYVDEVAKESINDYLENNESKK